MAVEVMQSTEAMKELQSKEQWVCWCLETDKDGKTTKLPYMPNGSLASTTNSSTWNTYQRCLEAVENHERNYKGIEFTGVGFVFNDDYTGVDLDHCIAPDGSIDAWAQEYIDLIASYAEFSPSVTGIHIIPRAKLPEDYNKDGELVRPGKKVKLKGKRDANAAIEMYCQGRFFTVTSNHVTSTPATIESRQKEVAALFKKISALSTPAKEAKKGNNSHQTTTPVDINDADLIEKAMSAANGATFRALWNGNTSGYSSDGDDNDHSSADLALCNLLAFWTGKDAARIDRLFRQSGLIREKWDRNARSGETYGQGTIDRAIASCNEIYTSSEPKAERRNVTPERPAAAAGKLQEIVIVGRQYRDVSEQALAALHEGEKAMPLIFVKAGELVRVARNERGDPILQNIGIAGIRNALTRTANYFRLRKLSAKEKAERPADDDYEQVPTSPPKELAEYILAMDPSEWPFPPLAGIVEMPIMRPDGSILDIPGYDRKTHLYYIANDAMKQCKIPQKPTPEQVSQAVALIDMCIGEFPYESQADYANMFALLITLVTRYMYDGDVMTALINATKQGTGKSLLAQFACIIACGRPPAMTSFPAKEEETKKVIDAKVLAGVHTIVFDNIKRKFQSAALDMLTTCRGYYSVRPLGQSKDITVYTQTTVIATGNNVQLDTDQARRCYQIRLLTPVSNPDERTDITIKELDLYAIEHRAELVAALLTIVRSWYTNGKPQVKNKLQSSSFGRWAGTVGNILAHAGIEGFQENRDKLKAEANSDELQIANFLQTWYARYNNKYVPAMTILDHILDDVDIENKTKEGVLSQFLAALPDDLQSSLFDRERKKQSMVQIFVKWLVARVKTPYGHDNLHIECTEDTVKRQKIWRISTGGTGGTGGQSKLNAREKNESSNNPKNAHVKRPDSPPVPPVPPVKSGQQEQQHTTETGVNQATLTLQETAQTDWLSILASFSVGQWVRGDGFTGQVRRIDNLGLSIEVFGKERRISGPQVLTLQAQGRA